MAQAPTFYPIVSYRDAQAALSWLQEAFGFESLFATPGPDGTIAHAELSFDTGVVMVNTARAAGEQTPDWRDATQSVYVAVEDADAHCERARAAGAEITRELENTEYGSREYSARDLEGHHWHFGTYRPAPAGTT
ncbi:MAG: VOC family protein [Gaiellaceae bacterium]